MITEAVKSKAIAQLRQNVSVEDVAMSLDLPEKLIREWEKKLDPSDMVAQEASVIAIEKLTKDMSSSEIVIHSEKLRELIEETAIDLVKAMAIPMMNGDMAHGKTIEMLSNSLVKMYHMIVLKGGVVSGDDSGSPSNSELSIFQTMMRD